jgi:Tfp pilus assembly protein PilX
MRTILRRLRDDERGIAMIIALGVIVVLSVATASAIEYTASNSRNAAISDKSNDAYSLAEAGINNAMAILSRPSNNAMDQYALCPDTNTVPALPCWHSPTATCASYATGGSCWQETATTVYSTGTVTWSGTFTQNVATGTAYWVIKSTGQTVNPSRPGATPLKRTITANIAIVPTVSQPLNNPSWNYVFVRAPGWTGQGFNGCDMTLTNSVNVTANLYVLGNLCFQNTSQMTKGILYVKGSVDQQATQNTIGTSSLAIAEAHIGMGCRWKANSTHNPCQGGSGASGNDQIWANVLNSSIQTVTPPDVDWNGWYINASPGPYFPCQNTTNLPTWSFDSPVAAGSASDAVKLTYKNDNAGTINLTPGTSYTCQTLSGELSWNATTHVMTVKGTMYIDGSAYVDNGATNLYHGSGVLYLSGTFLVKNSNFCPQSATTSCSSASWDNAADLLGIVAAGNGSIPADSQVSVGDSVQLVSSHMMGAIYAANAIDIGTTSLMDGPMDGASIILGQSTNSTFNGFTYVPVGLPGENTVYAQPLAPTFSGG